MVASCLVAALTGAGCTGGGSGEGPGGLAAVDLSSPSLTSEGRDLAEEAGLGSEAPRYGIDAVLEPETGTVEGSLEVEVRLADPPGPIAFRYFPNLAGVAAPARVEGVTVEDRAVEHVLDRSLLSVPVPEGFGAGDRVSVSMRFSYTVPQASPAPSSLLGALGAVGGEGGLSPAEVGLLARHPDGVALGHWFPTLLPPGSDDPDPAGFGDIGNFSASLFALRLDVPQGWEVVTSGVGTGSEERDGRKVHLQEGAGLRDFAAFVGRDLRTLTREAGPATVSVRASADLAEHSEEVAGHASAALATFSGLFGPYPWAELDVVAVPLAAAVGGMEWPGMIWISSEVFAGGIPGLGQLGGLFDSLGSLLGGADPSDPVALAVSSTREFVIAHEVAHQWWHALVGNDPVGSPVVDEPLAQFSSCLYWEEVHGPDEGRSVCEAQVALQYHAMRALGVPDAPAEQPSDAFESSLQYAGVVYGKAPGFYREARELLGGEKLLAGLRTYATRHAFRIADPSDLRGALAPAGGRSREALDGLWTRWMTETHGDADMGEPPEALRGLPGLGGIEGQVGGLDTLDDLGALFESLRKGFQEN